MEDNSFGWFGLRWLTRALLGKRDEPFLLCRYAGLIKMERFDVPTKALFTKTLMKFMPIDMAAQVAYRMENWYSDYEYFKSEEEYDKVLDVLADAGFPIDFDVHGEELQMPMIWDVKECSLRQARDYAICMHCTRSGYNLRLVNVNQCSTCGSTDTINPARFGTDKEILSHVKNFDAIKAKAAKAQKQPEQEDSAFTLSVNFADEVRAQLDSSRRSTTRR